MPEVALPEIAPAVLWLIALGFAGYVFYLDRTVFQPIISILEGIPAIGGTLAAPIKAIVRWITEAAQFAVNATDHLMGISFHVLAKQFDWVWSEIKRHAYLLTIGATMLQAAIYAYHHLHQIVHGVKSSVAGVAPRLHRLEKEWKGIEHGVKQLGKLLAAFGGIDALIKLLHGLHGLRKSVNGAIAGVRGDIAGLKGALSDLKGFLGIRNGLTYLEWAAGIVAAAIGVEALNLFRCSTFQNKTAKRGCGLWDGLEKLLGLVGLLAVGFTFQEFVDAAETVAGGIGTFVGDLEAPFVGDLPPLPPPKAS